MKETTALRATYFLYLGAIGLIVTYWPLYFQSIGMSPAEIGLVFSGRSVISVLMQPALARLRGRFDVLDLRPAAEGYVIDWIRGAFEG